MTDRTPIQRLADYIARVNEMNAASPLAHMNSRREIACRGGRTGKKVHAASAGSSVTACGIWMKANACYFEVRSVAQVKDEHVCERCFPVAK